MHLRCRGSRTRSVGKDFAFTRNESVAMPFPQTLSAEARGRGRSILLEITDKGRAGYLEAARIVEQVDRSVTGGLTSAQRAGTLTALKVIADGSAAGLPG